MFRLQVTSDGSYFDPLGPDEPKGATTRTMRYFRNPLLRMTISTLAANHFNRHGMKTSPVSTVLNAVIVAAPTICGQKISRSELYAVNEDLAAEYAAENAFREPPEELAFHLCRTLNFKEVTSKWQLRKLIVMTKPFMAIKDRKLVPSRWIIDCMNISIELSIEAGNFDTSLWSNDGLVYIV